MKATDLMIGDWVEYKGTPHIVVGILSNDEVKITTLEGQNKWVRFTFTDKINPISITPKILEENGWHYDDIDGEWYGFGFLIAGYSEEYTVLDGRRISYVHELQHFLKDCKFDNEIVV